MKRLFTALVAVVAIGLAVATAQQVNRSVQISQDPSGPMGFDTRNGVYFPGNLLMSNNRTIPTIHSCGTSPNIATFSNDSAGRASLGTSTTSCGIYFAVAYASTPYCFTQAQSVTAVGIQPTAAGFIATTQPQATFSYFCIGQQQ